ncbi:MAG: hypothetical protein CM15mP1_1310 [Methanobacteriota archaeon]|nr:MAG: hypothetical protein CM15mP1_1310 [Euryarchaeota archaeon]
MEPHDASKNGGEGVKSWMVKYTVEVGGDLNRHLSMINADDISDVHHHLLIRIKKMYQTSERVDVTVHRRIEPVSTCLLTLSTSRNLFTLRRSVNYHDILLIFKNEILIITANCPIYCHLMIPPL